MHYHISENFKIYCIKFIVLKTSLDAKKQEVKQRLCNTKFCVKNQCFSALQIFLTVY